MCGIAGFVNNNFSREECNKIIDEMTSAIEHRGPDNFGFWNDTKEKLFFGHRRLSILDLSNAGNQPMTSLNGRFTIVYNGEIYNFREMGAPGLRKSAKFPDGPLP